MLLSRSCPFRRAVIIAVGSEMLTPTRVDTNSLFITDILNAHRHRRDLQVHRRRRARGARLRTLRMRWRASDLVVLTGGLGPTEDDMTREVVADHLRLPLAEDAAIIENIQQRFAARGWKMPEVNRRQAMVPHGAVVLDNPNGTAPGSVDRSGGQRASCSCPGRRAR